MDFDEHDDPEEEIGGMSVQESPYDDSPSPPPLGNSSASRAGLPHNGAGNISKMGGPGEPGSATVGQQQNQLGSMSGGGSSHNRSKPPGSGSASAGGKYKECLKNHAVGIGGHAVDGCGEFLPAGEEGTMDALRCAACNCHRNFHRRELDPGTIPPLALLDLGGGSSGSAAYHHAAAAAHHYPSPAAAYYPRTPGSAGGGYLHHPQAQQPALHYYHHPHFQSSGGRPLALPSTSGGGGSRDEQEGDMLQAMSGGGGGSSGMMMMMGMSGSGSGSGKNKRFRTKFSQEQKDKMLAFSERLGWRIQKHDEAAVQEFCAETGIKRHVLKDKRVFTSVDTIDGSRYHRHGHRLPAERSSKTSILSIGMLMVSSHLQVVGEEAVDSIDTKSIPSTHGGYSDAKRQNRCLQEVDTIDPSRWYRDCIMHSDEKKEWLPLPHWVDTIDPLRWYRHRQICV